MNYSSLVSLLFASLVFSAENNPYECIKGATDPGLVATVLAKPSSLDVPAKAAYIQDLLETINDPNVLQVILAASKKDESDSGLLNNPYSGDNRQLVYRAHKQHKAKLLKNGCFDLLKVYYDNGFLVYNIFEYSPFTADIGAGLLRNGLYVFNLFSEIFYFAGGIKSSAKDLEVLYEAGLSPNETVISAVNLRYNMLEYLLAKEKFDSAYVSYRYGCRLVNLGSAPRFDEHKNWFSLVPEDLANHIITKVNP